MWARRLLGLLLLAMAAGKLTDLHGYFAALQAFALLPAAALPWVGATWAVLELGGGLLLLPDGRGARAGGLVALVVSIAYAVMTTQAYARHLEVRNCTCFGVHLAQRLSWFVLVQDGYVIVWAAWVTWRAWRGAGGASRSTPRSPAGSPARSS